MKSLANELAVAEAPVAEEDLIIFILNGLSSDFEELSTTIRARETAITFEELHDKLTDYETILKQDDFHSGSVITANDAEFFKRDKGHYSHR